MGHIKKFEITHSDRRAQFHFKKIPEIKHNTPRHNIERITFETGGQGFKYPRMNYT
jgi:hypothetical protein